MSSLESQLHDTVRYLRRVRPLDPHELATYVDGDAASVEAILRRRAVDWGIIEVDTGRYEPAPSGAIPTGEWAPHVLPSEIEEIGSERLRAHGGRSWASGDSGDRLRAAVDALKADYMAGRTVSYTRETLLAYLIYHLPRYYATIGYVLTPLLERGLLQRPLKIADVGAGTGGPMLGIGDILGTESLIEYHAIEPSPAIDMLEQMTAATSPNLHPRLHRSRVERWIDDPDGPFDLIICANILGELDDPTRVMRRLIGCLQETGALVIVEPGDREQSVRLRKVERALTAHATVFAPEVRLWPGYQPSDTGWGFDVGAQIDPPSWQRQLQAAAPDPTADTYLNPHVQFSYSILRPDGQHRYDPPFDRQRVTPLADTISKITDRINVVGTKLSHDLSSTPESNGVFRIGDGSQTEDHFIIQTVSGELVDAIDWVPYGAVCRFDGVLALWNDTEGAVNLVVDHASVVEPLAVPDTRANHLGSGPPA